MKSLPIWRTAYVLFASFAGGLDSWHRESICWLAKNKTRLSGTGATRERLVDPVDAQVEKMIKLLLVCIISLALSVSVVPAQTLSASSSSSAAVAPNSAMNGTISVSEFQHPGISVLQYSPELAAILPGTASENVRDMLPYSAIVRNGTPKSIVAYTLSWTTTDETGKTYADYRTVCGTDDIDSQIAPNTDKLITVLNSPNEDVTGYLERFQHEMLRITLESVMFDDGSTAGRDASQSMAQVKASLKSEFDLLHSVLARDRGSIISWLQRLVDSVKPGSRLDFSEPFAEWYRFYQARQAAGLIRMAEANGISEMIASVQITLQNKHYPAALVTWRGQ